MIINLKLKLDLHMFGIIPSNKIKIAKMQNRLIFQAKLGFCFGFSTKKI